MQVVRSERKHQRAIDEIDVLVGARSRSGFFDKIAGEEMAVADVAGPMPVDLPGQQRIKFRANVFAATQASGDERSAGGVVHGIVAVLAPGR